MKTSLTAAGVPTEIRTERLQNAPVECDHYANPLGVMGMFRCRTRDFLTEAYILTPGPAQSLQNIRVEVNRSSGRDDRSIHATRRPANTMLPPCWIT